MSRLCIDDQQIEELWSAFRVLDRDGNNCITITKLAEAMASLGAGELPVSVLEEMIREVDTDRSGAIDRDEFRMLMLDRLGSDQERLKLAFSVFDQDGSGLVGEDELSDVMAQVGLSGDDLKQLMASVDRDGDGRIDFEEFCRLVEGQAPAPITPRASSVAHHAAQPASDATLATPAGPLRPQVAQPTQASLAGSKRPRGTSRLQMRIALFRLIQGAAYRCFRESFSANHETHLQVRNLPYRISDFVPFVETAIALYKQLGIVELACYPALDAVTLSIQAEMARLQQRIQQWSTLKKTPAMIAEAEAMASARDRVRTSREMFLAGVEFAISMKKSKLGLADVVEGILALQELNRLRQAELAEEFSEPEQQADASDAKGYLQQWHRVILEDEAEVIEGAMMPVAYWYEDFMPKLLDAFSVETADDMNRLASLDEAALDAWYVSTREGGEFSRFGGDVAQGFAACTPRQKRSVQEAWELTYHYLNGLQKRRERQDFGRDSGALSHYVAFIDVHLGRSDIRDAQMRVSFPYYIGPAIWRFFHTSAEIISAQEPEQQVISIQLFKSFFAWFARLYPCPYCRHHLNAYVVQNRELDLYPLEYLMLGKKSAGNDFRLTLQDKLETVTDGPSLRLFLWKLHNTVSASIARTEEWYRRDQKAFYTSRYWPSIDSELARSHALGELSVATERLVEIYDLLKPVALLAALRLEFQEHLEQQDPIGVEEISLKAQQRIESLEAALEAGGFLEESYRFDPSLVELDPAFTPEEEAFSRTNLFIET
jgi:Ca2+-binding EF-hand superfamily protein